MKSNKITIGEYTIHKDQQIGSGGQGSVYKCSNKSNDQLCAKIVNLEKDDQMREYQIINQLLMNPHHENLVFIKHNQLDEQTKTVTIIMEICERNLRQELKQRESQKKAFSNEEIYDFIYQFLQGYKILYNSRILHRDIKPDNILIKQANGKLIYKITDFGIEVTQISTPSYGAPELMHDNGKYKYDQNPNDEFPQSLSDIYSLGLVIYELITGALPFKNKNYAIKNYKQTQQGSPFKNETQSKYKELVESMLHKEPKERITFPELFKIFQDRQHSDLQQVNAQIQPFTHFHSEPSQTSFQPIQKINNQQINQNYQAQTQNLQFVPIFKQPQQVQIQPEVIKNRSSFSQFAQNDITKNNYPPNQQQQQQQQIKAQHIHQPTIQKIQKEQIPNQFQLQQRYTANINQIYPQKQIQNQMSPNDSKQFFKQNFQPNINVNQTIFEYLDEIINNFEGLFNKAKLKELQDFKLKKLIQENDVKRLKNLFEYQNSKLGTYSLSQLKFFIAQQIIKKKKFLSFLANKIYRKHYNKVNEVYSKNLDFSNLIVVDLIKFNNYFILSSNYQIHPYIFYNILIYFNSHD